jgi:hypothetical protein
MLYPNWRISFYGRFRSRTTVPTNYIHKIALRRKISTNKLFIITCSRLVRLLYIPMLCFRSINVYAQNDWITIIIMHNHISSTDICLIIRQKLYVSFLQMQTSQNSMSINPLAKCKSICSQYIFIFKEQIDSKYFFSR